MLNMGLMSGLQEYVHTLDSNTGASLKLSILNPKGRIWTMVAGGGASVIYADTVGDLGYAHELGNYAEYSGAPNQQVSRHTAGMSQFAKGLELQRWCSLWIVKNLPWS